MKEQPSSLTDELWFVDSRAGPLENGTTRALDLTLALGSQPSSQQGLDRAVTGPQAGFWSTWKGVLPENPGWWGVKLLPAAEGTPPGGSGLGLGAASLTAALH